MWLREVLRDFALGANGKTAKKAFSRLLKKCRRQGKRENLPYRLKFVPLSLVPCPFSLITDAFFISLLAGSHQTPWKMLSAMKSMAQWLNHAGQILWYLSTIAPQSRPDRNTTSSSGSGK